jgi:endonuclease III
MKKKSKKEELMLKGKLYSEQLGIKLETKAESELFKWFLASMLFGKPISENIAIKTYKEFERAGILTPRKILDAGWDKLVELLDAGGYVRYDFSTADKLLAISKELLRYGKKPLTKLHAISADSKDLEKRLQQFKGIGPVTCNIFLRELRHVWPKADPEPLPIVKKLAKQLGIKLPRNRKTKKFVKMEAALIRLRKQKTKRASLKHN